MKSLFKHLYDIVESISRARAAAHFTRMGKHDLAKEIMLKD